MNHDEFDVVTGAFSYTGRYIATRLIGAGRPVRTLTGHPDRDPALASEVDAVPYAFDNPVTLAETLRGTRTLYNTYWVRFDRRGVSFDHAIANSEALFSAAKRAGVERIVHVSITNPSLASDLPYFKGKALVEQALASSGVSFSIVRPTVVFGCGDILVNNIAYLLRRLPVFGIAEDGSYRVRPVHVDDVARLCIELASTQDNLIVDAVGPESFTFDEFVRVIADAIGQPARLVHLPSPLLALVASALGAGLRDRLLTADEVAGLVRGLVDTSGPTTGLVDFRWWLAEHAQTLGRRYASEVERHFDHPDNLTLAA